MSSHWPVIVGINQYQFLQPLLFAQFDAVELKDFLVNEVGLPPQQCSLLTDISPMVYQGAAFPTREVILQRLQQTCERAAAEDTVWFFFSGYGVHWQGQDYLLPIDGDPDNIVKTGIPLQAIFDVLQKSPALQRLLMLDMNRSQSALPNQRLGVPTMELAKELDMALLMSCRPNQFSQETLALRHGLFTEAVLEGMRFHGCLTLSQLAAYVHDRLPELCQHHFRPEQNPVAVIPAQYQFLMLVPPSAVGQMAIADTSEGVSRSSAVRPISPSQVATLTSSQAGSRDIPRDPITPYPVSPYPDSHQEERIGAVAAGSVDTVRSGDETVLEGENNGPLTFQEQSGTGGWQRWWLLAAGMLLLGVLLRNQSTFLGRRQPDTEPPNAVESVEASSPEEVNSEDATEGSISPEPGIPSADQATSSAEDPTGGEPLFPANAGSGASETQTNALDQARIAIEQRRFGEALNWLNEIPADQQTDEFATLQEQARTGYTSASRGGETILNSARQIIEPMSASLFNDAIEEARQISVGDEYYEQAQADIARWSRVILDLAQGRAANGDFDAAISAASLVPSDQEDIYAQAQAEIRKWQQQQVNRQLLQDAQARLQPDQATSFEEAIVLVQQIPPGTPEYDAAQQRIDQWSQDILVIARARAADGQLPGAIAAAELVPPGTSAYDQAQEEIVRWQGQ